MYMCVNNVYMYTYLCMYTYRRCDMASCFAARRAPAGDIGSAYGQFLYQDFLRIEYHIILINIM